MAVVIPEPENRTILVFMAREFIFSAEVPNKMKFYIAALLAFSDLEFAPDDASQGTSQPGSLTLSMPMVIRAESIEHAGEVAHEACLKHWKPEEGWHTHQANIMVLTEQFFDLFVEVFEAGQLDMSDETPQTFNWDPNSRLKFSGDLPL